MQTSGRCLVALENKKGDMYQIDLDENGQAFVLQMIEQFMGGKITVAKGKLPIYLVKNKSCKQ